MSVHAREAGVNFFTQTAQVAALLLIPRILSASNNIIHDTDETYNYWEPLHFLVHGSGFQTWEYAPVYAIRSWAYILLHALPLKALSHIPSSVWAVTREQEFYMIRGLFGLLSALTETHLISSVSSTPGLGTPVALVLFVGLVCSTGMFNASTAFLPSTFAMYTSTLSLSFALRKDYFKASLSAAVGVILGWPFAILLFAPLLVISLFMEIPGEAEGYFTGRVLQYIRGFIVSCQVLLFSTVVDYGYYQRFVIVPLNIVLYNVFASQDGRGPELYGVEPLSYYFKNLLLNFNLLFPLALLALPVSMLAPFPSTLTKGEALECRTNRIKATICFAFWFTVFSAQPHKEERFMYPVYPTLILSAAVTLQVFVLPIAAYINSRLRLPFSPQFIKVLSRTIVLGLSASASVFRIFSMVNSYNAPLILFPQLEPNTAYCMGSDWYRFPTSFLLPSNSTLSFTKSSFGGLLPGKFNSTSSIPIGMNDRNQFSPDKVVDPKECQCTIKWLKGLGHGQGIRFVDRETGVRVEGEYIAECAFDLAAARRARGEDLFGRILGSDNKWHSPPHIPAERELN